MMMLHFSLLLLATLFAPVSPSLANQAKMMYVVLGVNISNYINYGCYCGPGTGDINKPPVDGIDACCYHHDHCYGDTRNICGSGNSIWLYATGYSWTFDRKTKEITCTSWESRKCARALCACDVRTAKCFAYYKRLTGEKKKCTLNDYAIRWLQTQKRPFEPWCDFKMTMLPIKQSTTPRSPTYN